LQTDKRRFDQSVRGVRAMKRHISARTLAGVPVHRLDEPDERSLREAAKISQARFAKLIGVNLRTLQNWEQQRTRPSGPARALLEIVASDPKSAIEAVHQ
jgi:putative transcriptional regulator